ncbi:MULTISPECIES: NADAR family protein [unclassified Legionella]|uniref:NADAR family protein n=1 Tax=unclassified Legionella TaxID=2622702 RepID=UPI001055515A|nr:MULTISPECIES: NADAR family protein [unclassified Legionella]MDI9818481.1 NADAR family protein [Legionella sp. PL877]
MSLPYILKGGIKIAPFKRPDIEPYGVFANTTSPGKYPIRQKVDMDGKQVAINWPSSEHAYHAQKILHLKGKLEPSHPAQKTLTEMLTNIASTNKEFSPRKDYDPLVARYLPVLRSQGLNVEDKKTFDALCDADYHAVKNPTGKRETLTFMRKVIQLKLEQHAELREKAIECAKSGIIPVEVSQYDNNWASGPEGKGENMLGLILLEEGNKLLEKQGGTPAIPDPKEAYKRLNTVDLAHNTLAQRLEPDSLHWVIPQKIFQPDLPNTSHKWEQLQEKDRQQSKSGFIIYEPGEIATSLLSRQEIESQLKKGTVPLISEKSSVVERYIRSEKEQYRNDAADIIAVYSVKSVMNNLDSQVAIQAVENSRAGTQGHDAHALKVKFNSQAEAQAFCEKLYREHGIHSHTFGADKMKTPQNGAVFLTKSDLEKIASHCQIAKEKGTGALVYETKINALAQNKAEKITVEDITTPGTRYNH